MFDSGVIGVAIGLALVFFFLSLLASGVNEVVGSAFKRRAKYLEAGVADLLGSDLKDTVYGNPIIQGLHSQKYTPQTAAQASGAGKRRPSYIPASSFSQTLLTMFTDAATTLKDGVSETETKLHVESPVGLSAGNEIDVGSERMRISAVSSEGEITVERVAGTAVEHAAGAGVTRIRADAPNTDDLIKDVRSAVNQLPAGPARDALSGMVTLAGANVDKLRTSIETWFDQKMERVSGWYQRNTRWWLLLYGVVIAVLLNADATMFARTLWTDATVREAVVAQAEAVAGGTETATGGAGKTGAAAAGATGTTGACEDAQCLSARLQAIKELGLPIGWPDLNMSRWLSADPQFDSYDADPRVPHENMDWLVKFFGIALTAGALSMGAPFWFDLLNKITNLRASGRPPKETSSA